VTRRCVTHRAASRGWVGPSRRPEPPHDVSGPAFRRGWPEQSAGRRSLFHVKHPAPGDRATRCAAGPPAAAVG
jgi:hypothetical protein